MENLVMNFLKNETIKQLHDISLNGARNILDEHGIAVTSIQYTEEDIENLLNREINVRERDILESNGDFWCHRRYANYLGRRVKAHN